jgi:hypothetical protein
MPRESYAPLEATLRPILPHILEDSDVERAEVDTSGIPQINIWLYERQVCLTVPPGPLCQERVVW